MSNTNHVEWSQLYGDLEAQGQIPAASSVEIEADSATFRGMYLDLKQIQEDLRVSQARPSRVFIHADVLDVTIESWMLQGTVLMISARRVEVRGSFRVNLDYRSSRAASFILYTNDLCGTIEAVAVTDNEHAEKLTVSSTPVQGGIQVAWSEPEGRPQLLPRTRKQGMPMSPTRAQQDALNTELVFASLLCDQEPAIALDIMTWVKDWSATSPELLDLCLRSSSLVALLTAQVGAQQNGASFVPYLTRQVYTDLASAFIIQAKQYESDYERLSSEELGLDQQIELAQALVDNKTYEHEYSMQLLDQARLNYESAVAAATAAKRSFEAAQRNAQSAQTYFETVGVPDWKRKQIAKAVISLGTSAIQFAAGIGSMLIGFEAGGAASADAAVKTAKTVANAADTAKETATTAKALAQVMEQLKKIVEGLTKIYELSNQVMAAVSNIQDAQAAVDRMQSMDIDTGGVDISATYEWEVFRLEADAVIQDPIDLGVGYAKELKLAVDEVAIYGQALAAAQHAVVEVGQQYANLLLQKQLAQKQEERLQQYVDALSAEQASIDAMLPQLYRRYLDTKSSLFAAIQGYRASYSYWALAPSMVAVKIIDPVTTLEKGLQALTGTTLDEAHALQRFSPPPQSVKQKLVVVSDEAVLSQLRAEGTATFVIRLDDPLFAGSERVRLTRVRVWLEGAEPVHPDTISVTITTTGNYQDRFEGTPYQFTAKPLTRSFQYRIAARADGVPRTGPTDMSSSTAAWTSS
jgi:hypothetical protein